MHYKILISFSILLLVCLSVDGKVFHSHACEGNKMKLFCHSGDVIKVIKADYGRSNASICEYFDDPNMLLNCHSTTATAIVKKRCDGKVRCRVEATNQLFSDPCPGQVKYVEAKYKCVTSLDKNHHHRHHTIEVLSHPASTAHKKREIDDEFEASEFDASEFETSEEIEPPEEYGKTDEEPEVSAEYELSDDEIETEKPGKAISMQQVLKYITNENIDTDGDIMF